MGDGIDTTKNLRELNESEKAVIAKFKIRMETVTIPKIVESVRRREEIARKRRLME